MASIVAADILEGPNEGGFRHQKNQAIQIQQDKGGTISPDPDHPDHAEKLSFKTLMATRTRRPETLTAVTRTERACTIV
ncbi:hypothetical protein MMC08_000601 [Hypocenomyce scalaris]|nr:hypothetical protein [Hypocenomyce scalaris]